MADEWVKPDEIKLLSGGNPQIPKGDGPAPVEAYIEALPDWKSAVGRHLDDLIEAAVPDITRAVRWNSPFYGTPGGGWIISYHSMTKYLKVTFFDGVSLDPMPPESSKDPKARYVHIFEDGVLDDEQFTQWVLQAAELPGWDGK